MLYYIMLYLYNKRQHQNYIKKEATSMKALNPKQKSLQKSTKSNSEYQKSPFLNKKTHLHTTKQAPAKRLSSKTTKIKQKSISNISKTLSNKENNKAIPKYSYSKNTRSLNKNRQVGYSKKSRKGAQLETHYKKAVRKVFEVLDIFSRGSISEANINRWIPQAALYFLGSIFQTIRNSRISMNFQQFQRQSLNIFAKSLPEDIMHFIDNIEKHHNFNQEKISLEAENQNKLTIQSHVQDRFSFQEGHKQLAFLNDGYEYGNGETSFRKVNCSFGQKTMPLQCLKQSLTNVNVNQQIMYTEPKLQSKQIKQHKLKQKITPLTDLNSFENLSQITRIPPRKTIADLENLPLQLPCKPNPNEQQHQRGNSGLDSPFFKGSISNAISRTVANKRKQVVEADRIDKLSLRLEDYIKQNAARIEKSKNCRIQL